MIEEILFDENDNRWDKTLTYYVLTLESEKKPIAAWKKDADALQKVLVDFEYVNGHIIMRSVVRFGGLIQVV